MKRYCFLVRNYGFGETEEEAMESVMDESFMCLMKEDFVKIEEIVEVNEKKEVISNSVV